MQIIHPLYVSKFRIQINVKSISMNIIEHWNIKVQNTWNDANRITINKTKRSHVSQRCNRLKKIQDTIKNFIFLEYNSPYQLSDLSGRPFETLLHLKIEIWIIYKPHLHHTLHTPNSAEASGDFPLNTSSTYCQGKRVAGLFIVLRSTWKFSTFS